MVLESLALSTFPMQFDQGITFQFTFPMECDQVTRCNQKFPNGIQPVISGAQGKEKGRE
jgi:hypothetical protein